MPRWSDSILKAHAETRKKIRASKVAAREPTLMSEAELQIFVAEYNDSRGLLWQHIPNEMKDVTMLGKLKKMGLKPGAPDVIIYSRSPKFPNMRGAAFELKVGKNTVKQNQRDWLDRLAANGWWTSVVRTPEEYLLEMERIGWI